MKKTILIFVLYPILSCNKPTYNLTLVLDEIIPKINSEIVTQNKTIGKIKDINYADNKMFLSIVSDVKIPLNSTFLYDTTSFFVENKVLIEFSNGNSFYRNDDTICCLKIIKHDLPVMRKATKKDLENLERGIKEILGIIPSDSIRLKDN